MLIVQFGSIPKRRKAYRVCLSWRHSSAAVFVQVLRDAEAKAEPAYRSMGPTPSPLLCATVHCWAHLGVSRTSVWQRTDANSMGA
jgi:hypothetical protein